MTKGQIEALVSNWLEAALDEAEDHRAIHGHLSESIREDVYYGLSALFDGANEDLTSGDYRRVAKEADEILEAAHLPTVDHASPEFTRLCRRLLRAKIEYARVEADRWEGEYKDHHKLVADPIPTKDKEVEVPSSLFSVVLEKYLAANPRPARTADPMKAEFMRFMEAVGGDKPIATITKADGVTYKESLQLTRKLHPTSCMKHVSNADAFFRWAEVHQYIPEGKNPMKGLGISKRQSKKAALKRRPFTDEELLTVLGSTEFLRQRTERPERYWVVLLCLFEVCRREEPAQLYHKDLINVEGIPCIKITDEEPDQTLKNGEQSRRRVPIHSSLIRLGFMEYVSQIKKTGHPRVFPQLTRKGNNGYADPVGKWFGRMVTTLGLTDPRLVGHSLRHGGITKLHSAGVPVNIVETLVGHSAGNVHQQYVHKELLAMKTLQEGLEKLQYPEVVKVLTEA